MTFKETIISNLILLVATVLFSKIYAESKLKKAQLIVDSELEKIKLKLTKSEYIFDKELEAANELVKLYRDISPKVEFPGMEMSEACERVSANLGSHEDTIEEYLRQYKAILPLKVSELLQNAHDNAAHGKFDEYGDDPVKSAEYMLDNLRSAEEAMIAYMQKQYTD